MEEIVFGSGGLVDPEQHKLEELAFGVFDDKLSERLRLLAAAQRAAHPDEPSIPCSGPGCRNRAREFWYFCSQRCRDGYVGRSAR